MSYPLTLSKYFAKRFFASIMPVLAVFAGIIIIFDTIELLRRAEKADVSLLIIVQMVILKLPTLLIELAPFVIFISAMLCISNLNKKSEITATKAAGISVWQYLSAPILAGFLIGIILIVFIQPIGSVMMNQYRNLENKNFYGNKDVMAVSSTGLWLRKNTVTGKVIVHALKASSVKPLLYDVTIYYYNNDGFFNKKIYAPEMFQENDVWIMPEAKIVNLKKDNNTPYTNIKNLELGVKFDSQQIYSSAIDNETVSFWSMQEFINNIEIAGLSAIEHKLRYQKLLTTPFLFIAMIMLASLVSLRLPRKGKAGLMFGLGLGLGFIVKFFIDLIGAMGLSGTMSITASAWTPVIITIMIGSVGILHLEDG